MQPLLVHYCNICTYNTTVPFTASVFSENQSCSHCGTISAGINVRGKQEEETNMQQEELARLFSANLTLSQAQPQYTPSPPQPEQQIEPVHQQQEQQQRASSSAIVYASQHYTHTHHVVPIRHIPKESVKTHIDASELEGILLRNSVNPRLLFPSQIDLFKNADDDQRLRLLELWRISPPQGRQGFPAGVDYNISRQLYDWPPTSLAQEEAMAKLRYERMIDERAQAEDIQSHQQQLNQSMDDGMGSAAVQATRDLLTSSPDTRSAEPYIVSGYDMLANREYEESAKAAVNHLRESTRYNQATDPVYNNAGGHGGLWEKNVGSILDMENQYGAFAQARDRDVQSVYADDEMVM
ncbi:uncharacterized protein BDR25DRAFT_322973 [Lindgomyces ingoldianus]|uniref:Uncharacterized protein n=1 Tax=Lindgomyces ingoldianus TaxID=673940 RepID=A0ACB6R8P4_9PLEO|nr:uncharacterized protein BDR25DRAFT_322973 [Lindgomyces ingoldianus]KAF2474831.1 hypothetical protein BDR25DRAFT_322973 [Lindgomyces ingoldianus]